MEKRRALVLSVAAFLLTSAHVLADPLLTYTKTQDVESPVARYGLYLLDAGVGGDPTEITPPGADALSPAWSPDGSRLAFASLKDGDPDFSHDLYTMRPDGGGLIRLTNTADVQENSPAWSFDGRRIAFLAKDLKTQNRSVWMLDLDSGAKEELVPHGAVFSRLAWSPDGQQVAFSAAAGGTQNVYAVHVDSGEVDLLYEGTFLIHVEDWLPTGEILILDFGHRDGVKLGLLFGGAFEVLFPEVQKEFAIHSARSAWRWPDLFVFNAVPADDTKTGILRTYRVKRNGTGLRKLLDGGLVPDLWYDARDVQPERSITPVIWGEGKRDAFGLVND